MGQLNAKSSEKKTCEQAAALAPEAVNGLFNFIRLLQTDPAFMLEKGEALGFEAGVAAQF